MSIDILSGWLSVLNLPQKFPSSYHFLRILMDSHWWITSGCSSIILIEIYGSVTRFHTHDCNVKRTTASTSWNSLITSSSSINFLTLSTYEIEWVFKISNQSSRHTYEWTRLKKLWIIIDFACLLNYMLNGFPRFSMEIYRLPQVIVTFFHLSVFTTDSHVGGELETERDRNSFRICTVLWVWH